MTIQGLTYERVTNLRDLKPGEWLRKVTPQGGSSDAITVHLTVVRPYADQPEAGGVLCLRHGRDVLPTAALITLDQPAPGGDIWRATQQPRFGIPGTSCDGYDGNGNRCGLSLHHTRPCAS
ncbi:hypothetical protein [Streptomyces sp. DH12]|uniref:hypothetical protein n=1 Tax=Streptomyces sp. DH12 TaxID=2857010 RepID=UPI001E64747E|nr:hypothetical protein [Streptomyces sp. DH12]